LPRFAGIAIERRALRQLLEHLVEQQLDETRRPRLIMPDASTIGKRRSCCAQRCLACTHFCRAWRRTRARLLRRSEVQDCDCPDCHSEAAGL
jgi:hypothetical protein